MVNRNLKENNIECRFLGLKFRFICKAKKGSVVRNLLNIFLNKPNTAITYYVYTKVKAKILQIAAYISFFFSVMFP